MKHSFSIFNFTMYFVLLFTVACESNTLTYDNEEKIVCCKSSAVEEFDGMYRVHPSDVTNFLKYYRPGDEYKQEPIVIEKDTAFYIVNFKKGWIVLDSDKRMEPIVASSQTDNLDFNKIPEGVRCWFEWYADKKSSLTSDLDENMKSSLQLWKSVSAQESVKPIVKSVSNDDFKWCVRMRLNRIEETLYSDIDHIIETKWGQGSINNSYVNDWNMLCPMDGSYRCPTGCTAVALAQLVYFSHYYLNKPTRLYHNIYIGTPVIYGETQNIGFFKSLPVDPSPRWDEMPLTYSPYCAGNRYVAELMMDIGNQVDMKYSGTRSGAYPLSGGLPEFNIAYTRSSYSSNIIESQINQGLPVMIVAWQSEENQQRSGGHTWLIDGLVKYQRTYVYDIYFTYTDDWTEEDEYYDSFAYICDNYPIDSPNDVIEYRHVPSYLTYLRMNWGYEGSYDNGVFSAASISNWTLRYDTVYKYKEYIYYDLR